MNEVCRWGKVVIEFFLNAGFMFPINVFQKEREALAEQKRMEKEKAMRYVEFSISKWYSKPVRYIAALGG